MRIHNGRTDKYCKFSKRRQSKRKLKGIMVLKSVCSLNLVPSVGPFWADQIPIGGGVIQKQA